MKTTGITKTVTYSQIVLATAVLLGVSALAFLIIPAMTGSNCFDSDENNYFIRGKITNRKGLVLVKDKCDAKGKYLTEYTCIFSGKSKTVILCPNGCKNGTCIPSIGDTRTFKCKPKPQGTEWNSVSEYMQTWDGSKWLPIQSDTKYSETASTSTCNFRCQTGIFWNKACVDHIDCSKDSYCGPGGRSCISKSTGKQIFAPTGYSCFERVDSTTKQPVIIHNAIIKKTPKTLPYKLLIVPIAIEGTSLDKGVQCCARAKDIAGNDIYILRYCAASAPANLIRHSFLDILNGSTLPCYNDSSSTATAHGINYIKDYWQGAALKYNATYPITISISDVKYFPANTHPETFSTADQFDWFASFIDVSKVDVEFDGIIFYLLGNNYNDYGQPKGDWIGFSVSAHPYISKTGKAFRFFYKRWMLSDDYQSDAYVNVQNGIHEFGHFLGATDLYQYMAPNNCLLPQGVPDPSNYPQKKACDMCSRLMTDESTTLSAYITEYDYVICDQSAKEIGWSN